jgi:hypothetical protein
VVSGVVTASLLPDLPLAVRQHEERSLQETVMQFLDLALPPDAVAHHSPGEGKRTRRAQGELKRSGYKAGWPDIEIVWRNHSNIFIELKSARGVMSDAQRHTQRRLTYCGCVVLMCRTLACVETSLRELGVPLRASVS